METINYKLIVLKACTENVSQKTPFVSYFIREAKRNRDNHVELADFFIGCNNALEKYKREIENQYNNEISKKKYYLKLYQKSFDQGEEKSSSGKRIQERIQGLKTEITEIQDTGLDTNYWCDIDETGEIANTFLFSKHRLYFSDITKLKQELVKAEKELKIKTIPEEKNESFVTIDLSKLNNLSISVIDKKIYNTDLIFDKFNNVFFECSKACFDAWLVNGKAYSEKIKYIYLGRKSRKTGRRTLNYAQLLKFIHKITGDTENTKDTYYKTVFGLNIKTSTVKPSIMLNDDLRKLLKQCEVKK